MTYEQYEDRAANYDETFEPSKEMSEDEENRFYDNMERLNNIQGWY